MKNPLPVLREVCGSFVRLRPHLRMGRWLLLSVAVCSFLTAPLEMVGVGMLIPMLAFLQGKGEEVLASKYLGWLPWVFPGQTPGFYFGAFCTLVVSALILKNLMLVLYQVLSTRMVSRAARNLRNDVFRRISRAPMHVFDTNRSGELTAVFSVEIIRTIDALGYLFVFIQRLCIAVCMLLTVAVISWEVTLSVLLLGPLLLLVTTPLIRRLESRGNQRVNILRRLGGWLNETFAGIRVLRATHAEKATLQAFEKQSLEMEAVDNRGMLLTAMATPMTEVLGVAGAMVVLAGTYYLLIVPGRLAAEYLMFIGFLLIRLLPMYSQISGLAGQLAFTSAGVREVERWLATPQYPERPFGNGTMSGIQRELRFRNVSFRYPNGTIALENLNFTVDAGQTVALVGGSGSGKSTIASLLMRLRMPSEGTIEVDGRDYWDFSAESWHAQLGFVEQEAFLFHETITRNLTIGLENVSPQRLNEALRRAHLEDVIASLPKGVETVVGERGTMLSGGQKQRLAIARALLRDPQLLILDEATSALDNVSEQQVQIALDEARVGRTSVVIAHRLTTIRHADKIIVLERGRIVEEGTWDGLLERQGRFAQLVRSAEKGRLA
jgi:subfamily B ATP-binding cassette protein MsbA